MKDLLNEKCTVCEGGIPPLTRDEAVRHLEQTPGWRISSDSGKISREFSFRNFTEAIEFINKVAEIAESEDHHPDIHVFYNRVVIELWTHSIQGLSLNDFIVAAKINVLA